MVRKRRKIDKESMGRRAWDDIWERKGHETYLGVEKDRRKEWEEPHGMTSWDSSGTDAEDVWRLF